MLSVWTAGLFTYRLGTARPYTTTTLLFSTILTTKTPAFQTVSIL
uniref:Uncharacterized protein n=1 Tax=Faecalibaculum rodentium TaxID=1702221 RepID=A0A140DWQ7_9FIRM|nr:hypothetical protein AALO17_19500 [Faecalibaculum rodentium]